MKIKQKRVSKKVILAIIIACVAVASIVYVVYAQQVSDDNKKAKKPITYSGPTEQDKQDAANNKANVAKRQELEKEAKQESSSKKQVNPVITNASQSGQQVTITGYISGVFEDGGICTMIASKGSTTVTRTTKGFADATTTSCSPFFIERSVFSESGSWSVTIKYSSSSAEGTSQSKTLEIQ